ncbi:MAG: hypothetical protein NZL93_04800, partial [Chthoniobacterales bacterium]|nr:hypothetical protein [Chthoniobacterales bacterium]
MKHRLARFSLLIFITVTHLLLTSTLLSQTPRPFPEFRWLDYSGKPVSSKNLAGSPIIVLFSPTFKNWQLKQQIKQLEKIYQLLAAEKTLCFLATNQFPQKVISNIPFLFVANPNELSQKLNLPSKFAIAIVGRDGNLDLITHRRQSGQRVLDIIRNSFASQQA